MKDIEKGPWLSVRGKKAKPAQQNPVIKNDHILPHIREAGNPHDYGTVYERFHRSLSLKSKPEDQRTIYDVNERPTWARTGDIEEGPYLNYLKRLRYAWPSVGYLAEWMDVSTSPLKVEFLDAAHKVQRAKRTVVQVVDYDHAGVLQPSVRINKAEELRDYFLGNGRQSHDQVHMRIIIVEDLSREVIEILGSRFDIDPLFFAGQLADYKWFNIRDAWFEATSLQTVAKTRTFHQVEYFQARYFPDRQSKREADKELGLFNVLRRSEADNIAVPPFDVPGTDAGLIRSKMSLWWRPRKDNESGALGILLVDPTIKAGSPLWGGYQDFSPIPRMSEVREVRNERAISFFEDMVNRFKDLNPKMVEDIHQSPVTMLSIPLLRIASEWHLALQYADCRLQQVTWELERPAFLEHVEESSESTVQKLNPWRRRLPYMKKILGRVVEQITEPRLGMGDEGEKATASNIRTRNTLSQLHPDFVGLQCQLTDLIAQADKILSLAIGMVSIEESRKGIEQNKNVTRLTYIALVFVPMSFVASLFSMTTDLGQMKETFWVYFVVSVPISGFLLLIASYQGLLDFFFSWADKAKDKHSKKKQRNT